MSNELRRVVIDNDTAIIAANQHQLPLPESDLHLQQW